jgi:lipopolysaccharide export system protein LptC
MKWNFEEFRTYLLLEASHGDMVFSKEEQELITSKINIETYKKIYDEFQKDTEYERIQKISDAAKFHCDTADKKMELIENVKSIFESDGVVDQMEKNLMLFLKKMI